MTSLRPQIDMAAPRLFEDFRLSGESPERIREVSVVESAYESVLCADFTYVSTPITSGAALYRAMDAAGVASLDDIRRDKDFFFAHVIAPNLAAAEKVAHTMLNFGGAVISPAAFEAKSLGWSQDAYIALWIDTIEAKVTRIAMVDGWQYSNGGCEEYLQALLMQAGRRSRSNMAIVDSAGRPLGLMDAIRLLTSALEDVIGRGFQPTALARVLHRVLSLYWLVDAEFSYGINMDTADRRHYQVSSAYFENLPEPETLRDFLRARGDVYAAALSLLPAAEQENRSSLLMAPGLLRQSGREALIERPASVVVAVDDEA